VILMQSCGDQVADFRCTVENDIHNQSFEPLAKQSFRPTPFVMRKILLSEYQLCLWKIFRMP
jgi:hypothetical protein